MIITNQIRVSFNGLDGVKTDRMIQLAETYDQEVQALNSRLIECVSLLRKGLRSEAIQLATTAPDALDLAAELEFPEIVEWIDVLKNLSIRPPSRVNRNAVLQINEAILESQPIENLLKTHRRLAIARAPLALRLKTLRRIAKLDTANPVWQDDIQKWEVERAKEIPTEFSEALESEDWFKIERLHNELFKEKWIHKVSSRVVSDIQTTYKNYSNAEFFSKLGKLADELNNAKEANDRDRLIRLKSSWLRNTQSLTQPLPKETNTKATNAIAWLDKVEDEINDETEFRTALQKLEALIDSSPSIYAIQRAYENANHFNFPIPPEIQVSYEKKTYRLQTKSRRKKIFFTSAVSIALFAVGYLTIQKIKNEDAKKQLQAAVTQLTQLINQGNLEEAQIALKSIERDLPATFLTPEIRDISNEVTTRIRKIEDDRKYLIELISRADNENPALIRLKLLSEAEALASLDSDLNTINLIRDRRQAWEREQSVNQTKAVISLTESIRNQVSKSLGNLTIEQREARIEGFLEQLDNTSTNYPYQAEKAQSEVSALRSELSTQIQVMRAEYRRDQLTKEAQKKILASESLQQLAEQIELYKDEQIDPSLTKSLSTISKEVPFWDRANRLNQFLEKAAESSENRIGIDEATELDNELTHIMQGFIDNEFTSQFDELSQLTKRYEHRKRLISKLENDLSNLFESNLLTVLLSSTPTRFFITTETWIGARRRLQDATAGEIHGLDRVIDLLYTTETTQVEAPVTVIPEPKQTVEWLKKEFETKQTEMIMEWPTAIVLRLQEIHRRRSVDIHLKVKLTKMLLEVCCHPEASNNKDLDEIFKSVQPYRLAEDSWLDPQETNDSLPPFWKTWLPNELEAFVTEQKSPDFDLKSKFNQRFDWIGIFGADTGGSVQLNTNKSVSGDGSLYVIQCMSPSENKYNFTKVGDYENGIPTLDAPLLAKLPGRPVFLLSRRESRK